MKKLILIILFLPSFLHSQHLYFGVKGGLNISNVSGFLFTNDQKTYNKPSYNVYASGEYDFTKNFSLSAEAGFSRKGYDIKYDMYDINHNYIEPDRLNANIDYIDISLLPKLKLPASQFVFYSVAGPFLGIKTGSSIVPYHIEYQYIGDMDFFLKNFKTTAFGIKAGVGAEMKLTERNSVMLELRYAADLTSSYNTPALQFTDNSWNNSKDVKNQVVEIMAGVKF